MTTVTPPEHTALLEAAISESGLTPRQWARQVAWREWSTVRRWLRGRYPIPRVVLEGMVVRARTALQHETQCNRSRHP